MDIQAQTNPKALIGIVITLVFSGFLAFAYGFGIYLFPILGPDMKNDLGFSYVQMGYIAAGIQVGFILSSIMSGVFAPKVGELRFICASMVFCGLCLIALSGVQSPFQAAIILMLIGFVPAATWVPMVAVIRRFIAYSRRGTVFGFLSGSGGYGAIVNGQIVPILQVEFGWRSIWLGTGCAVLIFAFAGILILKYMDVVDVPSNNKAEKSVKPVEIIFLDSKTLKLAAKL